MLQSGSSLLPNKGTEQITLRLPPSSAGSLKSLTSAECTQRRRRFISVRSRWRSVCWARTPPVCWRSISLADFYYERRQLAQAEQLYKRVISIKDRAFGADHILLNSPVAQLRDIYIAQKQYSEAQALIEREIATQERVHGADSQLVGHSLNVLGGIHFLQKRYADAEPLFRRTLDIYELALAAKQADPRDPEFARALNALGLVYSELQRYADAEPLLLRAIAIREANVTPMVRCPGRAPSPI